ncbi:HAD family hydrolase [Lutimaribacter marinistellae]|uniref:HAD family hydrolase n=1 Tax=Lutimaribacter marinistellae TaxID=1820329 RepID=A0ABV7TNA9_9RHOB
MRLVALAAGLMTALPALADDLPSWRDTEAKARIIEFVETVTDPDNADYVTPARRVAVFDNDGTLWAEQPVYFQLLFALDRLEQMAEADPSIANTAALQAAAARDMQTLMEGGEEALIEVVNATHTGMTVEAFQDAVADWLKVARHPDTGLPFDRMTYQPMVELLRYLRDEGFTTYIVSGGGLHFMRVFAEEAYGIPPNQVLGTYGETEYRMGEAAPEIVKTTGLSFLDDKAGKPVNIERVLGRRPILAGGNSDGDFQMIEWTTAGDGARLGLIVHHTDAEREYAYDRESHVGRLVDGLDKGPDMGWLIVDMAKDWERIYTGQK